jgi:hypothetical protein
MKTTGWIIKISIVGRHGCWLGNVYTWLNCVARYNFDHDFYPRCYKSINYIGKPFFMSMHVQQEFIFSIYQRSRTFFRFWPQRIWLIFTCNVVDVLLLYVLMYHFLPV